MSHGVGYEKKDVNVVKVAVPTVLITIFAVLCLIGLDQYFLWANEKMYYKMVLQPKSKELLELRQKEDFILNNYEVVDAGKNLYRIPIERAMELQVRENSR